ncbi:MAG: alpha/beta hydrolase [Acidobacteria bacterium]|nr:MAG: alpha/beta hydrolase [Acidobacteriota bacterium]
MTETLGLNDIDLVIEGSGAATILMIHGWPDSYRLWDPQVAAFKDSYRCVRFTLPGFDKARPAPRVYKTREVVELIAAVVDHLGDDPLILMIHDWGSYYGLEYMRTHPGRVSKLVAVDVGDFAYRAFRPGLFGRLMLLYQWWLVVAWWLRGVGGTFMSRLFAWLSKAPAELATIHARMNYPYVDFWTSRLRHPFRTKPDFFPPCPMIYAYGLKNPMMFHSKAWLEQVLAREDSKAIAYESDHWVSVRKADEFNQVVKKWLSGA